MEALQDDLLNCFQTLSTEAKDLYVGNSIPEFEGSPESPLHFYRDWVSYNRPGVFRGAAAEWPAMERWKTNDYLRDKLKDSKVTVAVTPNGYADAISGDHFVLPHEEEMSASDFLDVMENPADFKGIHYVQRQNSNLTAEFALLLDDVKELPWARAAFGKRPDAINFWMGDGRAVTSTHKDPYENLYAVARGYKDVTLYPPSDAPWLDYKLFRTAIFRKDTNGDFPIEATESEEEVPWITVDPLRPDLNAHPNYVRATPLTVRVCAGDVLYLPSLWFHHLVQSHGCIAVNFWYDMEFDCKYNYFNFLQSVNKVRCRI